MIRVLLPCTFLCTQVLFAQSFQNNYGAGKYEEGVAVVADLTGITTVVRHYREGYGYGVQLFRTSLSGTDPVTLDIPMPGAAFPQSAMLASDGDIVIGGSIIPLGRHDHDAFLLKVTTSGSTVWSWTSANADLEEQFLCVDVLDDGYAAGGVRRSGAESDGLIARFNGAGTLLWQNHFGTPADEQVNGIAHDADGLVAVGSKHYALGDQPDKDVFTVRTDMQGTEQWQRIWGGLEEDAATAIIARADGSFVWAGYTDSYPVGDTTAQGDRFRHVFAMAINTAGDSIWQATFGDTSRNRKAWTLLETTANELLFAGENDLAHRSDAFTIRSSSTGTLIWERTFPLQRTDRLKDLLLMPDGGFIGTGKCTGPQGGQVLLLRKNGTGQ